MKVRNIHERVIAAPASRIGALLDSLASSDDALWPHRLWPAMKFDRPLCVGAVGGHGPVCYTVDEYAPGQRVRFRFVAPRGFNGTHSFEVDPLGAERTRLRHVLEMRTTGPALVSWPLVFRPLHNALIEDSLARAEQCVGVESRASSWSRWVKILRWAISGGRTRPRLNGRADR
jgi:hypothetical protein